MKNSVPVLSAGPLYFLLSTLLATLLAVQVFSHFWPIAWEFCSDHAGSVHGVVWRLHFASRTEIRVVFRVSRVANTLGFCMSPLRHRSTPAEAVGFELSRLVRNHENEENSPSRPFDRSTGLLIEAYLQLFGIEAPGIEC